MCSSDLESGTIRIVAWHDQTEKLQQLKEDCIVQITGGYVKENNNRKEIHLNDRSLITVNPQGIEVGEVKTINADRKKITELSENDENVELLATIVQVSDLKFFEICPECGKRSRMRGEDGFVCDAHGKITPNYSYVMNVFLDDGADNIRCVCFRNQANNLIGKTEEEIQNNY